MTKDELEKQILHLCSEEDDFALNVRVHLQLDWEKYSALKSLLYEYVEAVKHDKYIRREIFECVYATEGALLGALTHWVTNQHPERQKVSSAHADMIEILMDLMAPSITK